MLPASRSAADCCGPNIDRDRGDAHWKVVRLRLLKGLRRPCRGGRQVRRRQDRRGIGIDSAPLFWAIAVGPIGAAQVGEPGETEQNRQ
jgi:hypothetical protein